MEINVSLYDILIINLMCSISFSHEFRITSINYRCGNILDIQCGDCVGKQKCTHKAGHIITKFVRTLFRIGLGRCGV